ncbi:MAG: glycosyltransferase family 4 protein [Stellaceae bacterium]
MRPAAYSWREHPLRRLKLRNRSATVAAVEDLLAARSPALAVFSAGGAFPFIDLLELCLAKGVPFVTIAQANSEAAWCTDDLAGRYRTAFAAAERCFFVSDANRRLAERQIGAALPNAEVVRNPVNIDFDARPRWPDLHRGAALRFATVGRLHPPSKGQDILFEALAAPAWRDRRWQLHLYGEGAMRDGLERLSRSLGLSDRIVFAGFAPVEEIWSANHALVMPSRFEGLPLAMVEAMLCARPVIATDVAGHAEIVEDGVTGFLADAPTPRALAAALERFWAKRDQAEEIGKAGAARIRRLMPADPVQAFSQKLGALANARGPSVR